MSYQQDPTVLFSISQEQQARLLGEAAQQRLLNGRLPSARWSVSLANWREQPAAGSGPAPTSAKTLHQIALDR